MVRRIVQQTHVHKPDEVQHMTPTSVYLLDIAYLAQFEIHNSSNSADAHCTSYGRSASNKRCKKWVRTLICLGENDIRATLPLERPQSARTPCKDQIVNARVQHNCRIQQRLTSSAGAFENAPRERRRELHDRAAYTSGLWRQYFPGRQLLLQF